MLELEQFNVDAVIGIGKLSKNIFQEFLSFPKF